MEAGRPQGHAELGGVLLHGRYRTPQEMVDLSSRLHPGNIHWVVPSASEHGSWYPGVLLDPLSRNEPALTHAMRVIDQAADQAADHSRLDPGRLVMVGFSQGACLTLEYALRHPGRFRTLIVFTGALLGPPGMEWRGSPTMLSGTRVLLTGSDVDDWIPESRVHETARALENFGAAVDLRIYPGRPHEVSDAELAEGGSLIKKAQVESPAPS